MVHRLTKTISLVSQHIRDAFKRVRLELIQELILIFILPH